MSRAIIRSRAIKQKHTSIVGMGWDGMDAHAPDIVVIMRTRHGVVVGAGAPRCCGDGGGSGAGRGRCVAVAGHRDAARRRAMAACRCPSSTRCTSILMRDRNTLARTCGPCDRYAGCCAGGGSWRIHRGAPAPPYGLQPPLEAMPVTWIRHWVEVQMEVAAALAGGGAGGAATAPPHENGTQPAGQRDGNGAD